MRAVVHDRYGPPEVLRLADIEPPRPGPDDVLIRVHATTVSRTDCAFRSGRPYVGRLVTGFPRPRWRVLGSELAGTVEAIGPAVTGFAVGQEVFGLNPWRFGTHAEFVRVPQSGLLAPKPAGVGFDEAAAVCDGATLALMGLRPAGLRPGRSVLVYGASGSIGTAAVQLARHAGADVTAVCQAHKVEAVRPLGVEVVDAFPPRTFDVVFDAVGKLTFRRCARSLAPGGVFVATDGLGNLLLSRVSRRALFPVPPRYDSRDVLFLKQLVEEGHYRPVIDRRYPLEEVTQATRYVETGQKTGNVVLTVS
ncbi:NAD(P)-dependent alcohol dehydrogenase [Nonomuraea sediminis]|uniref:NAD(P)-dependent alcohol dehydrogenase n=1 Tax=Nonomuraea sediminis TaxID=2835864 RepID=UPI001BDCB36F|nr:NAD(P)-dependent alcohol dehydrogenase [Nonomuraea sediminis]